VSPDGPYLRDAILTVFHKAPCPPADIPRLPAETSSLRRAVYRAQIGSAAGKQLRWKAERQLSEGLATDFVSRNQLLDASSALFRERNADRTDIIHKYFVPEGRFAAFLDRARDIIPRHPAADLLNVTVRNVHTDSDAFLRYADQNMFAFVMLFNQERTGSANAEMEALTRELIDAALACSGRYYLPYRLHATHEQFHRAYPRAGAFFGKKRVYDPDEVFQNQFYARYGPSKP
jgi:FAD/FMN-containing dehydrogenase